MPTDSEFAHHWDQVYRTKPVDQTSWFCPHLTHSLEAIDALRLPTDAHIIDIGAGASSLIADLLARGFRNCTALDIAPRAIELARAAIPHCPDSVRWITGDVRTAELPAETFDLWHDRAAFHFLTDPTHRAAYIAQAARALRPGAAILISTFAPDGPTKCSGLEVAQLSPDDIATALGTAFQYISGAAHTHTTPWGAPQRFSLCLCRRRP